jgi:hypothetical protein
MQTFLPYASFKQTAKHLDWRRLGKQRVECKQIINALEGTSKGWRSHPATIMWENNVGCLKSYANTIILEWIHRGYNNTMELYPVHKKDLEPPWWLGCEVFHASHRSNLLRKDAEFYSAFGWKEKDDLPYYWPFSVKGK